MAYCFSKPPFVSEGMWLQSPAAARASLESPAPKVGLPWDCCAQQGMPASELVVSFATQQLFPPLTQLAPLSILPGTVALGVSSAQPFPLSPHGAHVLHFQPFFLACLSHLVCFLVPAQIPEVLRDPGQLR